MLSFALITFSVTLICCGSINNIAHFMRIIISNIGVLCLKMLLRYCWCCDHYTQYDVSTFRYKRVVRMQYCINTYTMLLSFEWLRNTATAYCGHMEKAFYLGNIQECMSWIYSLFKQAKAKLCWQWEKYW